MDDQATRSGHYRSPDPLVRQAIGAVQSGIDTALAEIDEPRVLEAGCGSLAKVDFGEASHTTGIDISQEQLDRNTYLDERILGDVENHELPRDHYDAVVCWYVFEHLRHPEKALANFASAVKPGGVVVIAVPNVRSPKVVLTKFSPHWFHVWAYRRLFGAVNAGRPGYAPFPTTIPMSMIPSRLDQVAREHGLQVMVDRYWEDPKQRRLRRRVRLDGTAWNVVSGAVRLLTFGLLDAGRTEYACVYRRPA